MKAFGPRAGRAEENPDKVIAGGPKSLGAVAATRHTTTPSICLFEFGGCTQTGGTLFH
jgi:hypothetical protein